MKITQKLVAEVKRSLKQGWRDQEWHDFMSLPEVEAIVKAMNYLEDEYNMIPFSQVPAGSIVNKAKENFEEMRLFSQQQSADIMMHICDYDNNYTV